MMFCNQVEGQPRPRSGSRSWAQKAVYHCGQEGAVLLYLRVQSCKRERTGDRSASDRIRRRACHDEPEKRERAQAGPTFLLRLPDEHLGLVVEVFQHLARLRVLVETVARRTLHRRKRRELHEPARASVSRSARARREQSHRVTREEQTLMDPSAH